MWADSRTLAPPVLWAEGLGLVGEAPGGVWGEVRPVSLVVDTFS